MSIIVGLVGEKGGGKETVGALIAECVAPKTVRIIRFSDVLADILDILCLERSRRNLQHLAVVIDGGFGAGTLTEAVRRRVTDIQADIVILDGVRWPTDHKLIRSIPGALLLYVTADARTRFERLRVRKEKAGEMSMAWEQFMEEEGAENERHIATIGASADERIENIGTLDELRVRVRHVVEARLKN